MTFSDPVCPEFRSAACCNELQNNALRNNFILVDTTFGPCPACAQNVRRLWCTFTCSPNQHEFVTVVGYGNHTTDSGDVRETLDVILRVHPDYVCGAFDSCKGLDFVATALTPASKFIGVMAHGALDHGEHIELNFTSEHALNPAIDNCADFVDAQTQNRSACSCDTCADACHDVHVVPLPDLNAAPVSVWEGFSVALVAGFWAAVALIVGAVTVFRSWR